MSDPRLNPAKQLDRSRVLQELARLDGRHDPSHPMRGTFTGLARPVTRLLELEERVAAIEARLAAEEPTEAW